MAQERNIVVNAASVGALLQNHEAVSTAAVAELGDDPIAQATMVAGINNALIELRDNEKTGDVLSSPPSALACQLQSFLAMKAAEENISTARELVAGGEEAKFDSKDWVGWAKSFFSWAGAIRKASWLTADSTPTAMPNEARVALFSDWGTGLYGAPAVSRCISADTAPFTHVIHLGDVYYSGTAREIDERQMPFWPHVDGARNFACNANHEMYSGGHGFFDKVLSMLGQSASYFALENDHWLLVGLDSAYEDHKLYGEQLGWLMTILNDPARVRKKLVLLSHHQPYSLIEVQGPLLISPLRLLLDSGRIYAWYWGHEHRCVLYDRHPKWKLAGRCIGFGGYPYFRDTQLLQSRNAQSVNGDGDSIWYRLDGVSLSADQSRVPGGLLIPGGRVLDGPNPYLDAEADSYGPHGYVALDFVGEELFETYYTPTEPGPTLRAIANRQRA